ncbi:3'-5' exonuclease [Veillonella magna]|uniref:3'-5' exonuclease n=1 Tax=Veillonella magna TaxID=464322 RepID=A0ABS2GIW2_9FIRM|nr:3'-5' exonuclease [Veillonella magna]MBM6824833.1 3'-5' exonuclease [Veillonella magna]MBM6913088.1 3'-5' exonuclease [Veillonella magna]
MLNFVAIDFETANKLPNSACSLAVVTVEDGEITKRGYSLIKPPTMQFDPECIDIHGILPKDVADKPTFDKLWPAIYGNHLKDKLIIAHNAKFDIGVMRAMLDEYGLEWPELDYTCTVKISRRVWPDLENHKLNTLAAFLGVTFKHHYALDDAETCAKVAVAAAKERGVDSMEALLHAIKLERESFVTEEKRAQQQAKDVGEQMSFF